MSQQSNLTGYSLGQYQILDEIGRGGMSVVYKAWQPTLQRYVALKVLAAHLASDEEFVHRFQQEAIVAANLNHPNIVTVYDVAQESGYLYIAMEYVEGRSLEQVVEEEGALSLSRTVHLLRQVADALDYAHQRQFVHRDVKPSNILITADERAIVTDFGIAKAMHGSGVTSVLTQSSSVIGTPAFMSPEHIQGHEVDYRTDLYSLGIVSYQMLSGLLPFDGTTTATILYAQVNNPPPSIRQSNPAIPAHVEASLHRILAKQPADRFQSAGAFIGALSAEDLVTASTDDATARVAQPWQQPEQQTVFQPVQPDWSQAQPGYPSAQVSVSPAARGMSRPWKAVIVLAFIALAIVCVGAGIGAYWWLGPPATERALREVDALIDGRQCGQAEAGYLQVLSKVESDPEVWRRLGKCYREQSKYDEAIGSYQRVVAQSPLDTDALRGLGEIYEAQEQWAAAAEWYDKWARAAPNDPAARVKLGWAYYRLKDYQKGLNEFDRVIALDPDTAEGYRGKGSCHSALKQYEEALAPLEKWAQMEPGNASAHRQLGWAYNRQKLFPQAIERLKRALELGDSDSSTFRGLGDSYYGLRELDDALVYFSRFAELEPDNPEAHSSVGWTLHGLQQYAEAAQAFSRALDLSKTGMSYRGLGDSYYKLGEYQQALRAFQEWASLEPGNASAYSSQGWAYVLLKDCPNAIPSFNRSLELDPQLKAARDGLAQCQGR